MENTLQLPTFEDASPTDVVLSVDTFETELETPEIETEEEQETQTDEPDLGSPDVDPLAQATYEAYVERGLLEEDSEFDGTFESLDVKLDQVPSKLLKQAIDDLPQHSQSVLKFIAAAGTNMQPEELKAFMKEYLGEQDLPDVSNLDSARNFMEQHLKAQGLRPNAIQAQLDDLEDSNELITEAEKLIQSKEKKTDSMILNKEQENQKIKQGQQEFVQSVNTTLTELGWSKPQQQKVLQTIPKTNEILGQIVKSPKAYVQLMDILSKFDGKDNFDLEAFKKQGESRVTSTLKAKLDKSGYTSGSGKTTSSTEIPTSDLFKDYKPIV